MSDERGPGGPPVPVGSAVPARRHRVAGGVSRGPILLVIVVLLIAGGLLDRAATTRAPATGAADLAAATGEVPVAAPPRALSSSWFCAGATDTAGGRAPGQVVIANSGLGRASGVVTLVPAGGASVKVPVTVPGNSRLNVPEQIPGGAAWIGAVVDVDAGAVSVEQMINGPGGLVTTPCATSGSAHWYFASGQTLINAGVVVSLLNPYPADAVVDLSFTTDQGLELPVDYQGIVVPPGGLVSVNLGDHLRRRQQIATTVTARTGRVVAWQTRFVDQPAAGAALLGTPAAQNPLADPAAPVPGVTVVLGAPSAGTRWVWPDGDAGGGVSEQYVVYNPGSQIAEVRLSISLDQGVAEPFELTVPPGEVIPVASDQQARIPAGVAHSAELDSLNGVPVVAERVVSATSPWRGIGAMLGQRVASPRWVLGGAFADPAHDGWVVIYNPGTDQLRVLVDVLSAGAQVPLAGLSPVTVLGGHRVAVHLNLAHATLDEALVVSSPEPIYVQSDIFGLGGSPGISLAPGVLLSH